VSAVATTIQPAHIRLIAGEIMVGRIRVDNDQALRLLDIWRDERVAAFQAQDEAAWHVAAALHGAMLRTILEADAWRRARGAAA
jgi:hypothetical protein